MIKGNELIKENNYINLGTYQGRDHIYNVVRLNNSINAESLSGFFSDFFADYFANNFDKLNGGNGNNILDLQNISLRARGLDILGEFTKLNKEKHGIRAILMNCNPATEQILNTTDLRKEFDIAYDWQGL